MSKLALLFPAVAVVEVETAESTEPGACPSEQFEECVAARCPDGERRQVEREELLRTLRAEHRVVDLRVALRPALLEWPAEQPRADEPEVPALANSRAVAAVLTASISGRV
ncbi:MAG: hypothetical protein V5A25_08015 [Halovenus sp.]